MNKHSTRNRRLEKGVLILTALIIVSASSLFPIDKTRLVVVIVIDQFPQDYIERFHTSFAPDGGFSYLLKNGAVFADASLGHAFTKTAAGHAAISTGSYGHLNGIPSNGWYDRTLRRSVNPIGDDSSKIIGTGRAGRAPRRMLAYTLGDMIRLGSLFRG